MRSNVAEIWTPSTFSSTSLSLPVSRPVEIVPHHIPALACATAMPRTHRSRCSQWPIADRAGRAKTQKAPYGPSAPPLDVFRRAAVLKLCGRVRNCGRLKTSFGDLLDCDNVEIVRGHLDMHNSQCFTKRRCAAVAASRRRLWPGDE